MEAKHLPYQEDDRMKVMELLQEFKETFIVNREPAKTEPLKIELKEGAKLIPAKPRRCSPQIKEAMKQEIDTLLRRHCRRINL